MTENEILTHWQNLRRQFIASQLAPTLLLGATVWFLQTGLAEAALVVRLAAVGILLASGVLGALAQFSTATEGLALADDLRAIEARSAIARRVVATRPWLQLVRFGTPALFVTIFLTLICALFFARA